MTDYPAPGLPPSGTLMPHSAASQEVKVKKEPVSPQHCLLSGPCLGERGQAFPGGVQGQVKTEPLYVDPQSKTSSSESHSPHGGLSLRRTSALQQAMMKKNQLSPDASHSHHLLEGLGSLETVVSNYSLPSWPNTSATHASASGHQTALGTYSCTIGGVGSFHSNTFHQSTPPQPAMSFTQELLEEVAMDTQDEGVVSTASSSFRETHQLLARLHTTLDTPGDASGHTSGGFQAQAQQESEVWMNPTPASQINVDHTITNTAHQASGMDISMAQTQSSNISLPSSVLSEVRQSGPVVDHDGAENTGSMETQQAVLVYTTLATCPSPSMSTAFTNLTQ